MPVFKEKVLTGQTALVTGATGGIGAETSRVLAEMGASVVVSGRKRPELRDLESELSEIESAGTISAQKADITDARAREELVRVAEQTTDPLSILINSAGVGDDRDPFEELSHERLERTMEVNFTSTVALTQAVYHRIKSRGKGAIVNISSLSGLRGTYRHIPYSGSKFALTGFTHSLAIEAIEHGIRVNAVCPGWVDTDMGRKGIHSKAELNDVSYEEQLKTELERMPSGRITDPSEVANTVGFLVTNAAPNVVGESIKISGGVVLR
jgi:3-oxoacyl-[acyl-carrier protein] reductase